MPHSILMTMRKKKETMGGTRYQPRTDSTDTRLGTDNGTRKESANTKSQNGGGAPKKSANPLRVLQINVQGCKTLRHMQVRKLLHDKDIQIILAQETLLGEGDGYSLPGYLMSQCECRSNGKACRGVATFIRKDLRASVENLKSATGTDAQRVTVWWDSKKYEIYNWYQSPSDKKVELDLGEGKFNFQRTIIAGDANAHHPQFGYAETDGAGQWLIDLTNSTNLTSLVSTETPCTFIHARGGEYRPDQALVSSDILEICTREVLEDVGSDHLPSLLTVGAFVKAKVPGRAKWNFKVADWKAFSATLDSSLLGVDLETVSIDTANKVLAKKILDSARKHIKRNRVRKYTPGWNEELAQAVARRQKARREFAKFPTDVNRKKFAACRRRTKVIGRKVRRDEWQKVCEKLDMRVSARKTWNLIRNLEGKRAATRVAPLTVAGQPMKTERQEAEAFNRFFSCVGKPNDPKPPDKKVQKAITEWLEKPGPEKRACEVDFTLTELTHALGKAKPGKAPGEDGVCAELLGHLGPVAKSKLLCLFNRTWNSGQLPKAWRTAIVVPIFKKGKSPKDISS